jgi:sec-independent protein translocase protein TatA
MNFGNIGFMELMVILVIVLVLFGARRVPEIGASIGKGIREFKKNINDADREIRSPSSNASLPPADLEARRTEEDAVRPEPKRLI